MLDEGIHSAVDGDYVGHRLVHGRDRLLSASGETSAPPVEPVSPLATLLDVLRDDAARAALIAELEQTVMPAEAETVQDPTVETAATETVSVARRIALVTQRVGEESVATVTEFWQSLSTGGNVFSGLNSADIQILLSAIPGLLAVIAITFAIFIVLRHFAKGLYAR